jgi:hypothetical protein
MHGDVFGNRVWATWQPMRLKMVPLLAPVFGESGRRDWRIYFPTSVRAEQSKYD